MKNSAYILWVLVFAAAFAACKSEGDSSGTGSGSALQLAEKVSVVDASSSSAATSLAKALGIKADPPNAGADSAWNTDVTHTYVRERTSESFEVVNEILCSIAQTQYDEMLNKGAFLALVDIDQCSGNNDSASAAGQSSQNQSSGSTMTSYEKWIVHSSRADDSAPQIVKAWIHQDASNFEPEMLICAKGLIYESVSDSNPYGIFTMNFLAQPWDFSEHPDGATCSAGDNGFRGYLKAERDDNGKVLLKFATDGTFSGDKVMSFSERAVLDRAGDGSTTSGSVSVSDTFDNQTKAFQFDIASNENYFLRSSDAGKVCLNRKDFIETAWRYGLYDANGARLNRNSGFPIRFESGGREYHGFVGYWGVWLSGDAAVNDGATVYKEDFDFSATTETPYTVMKVGGKLKKHTRNMTTLGAIRNVPLDYWNQITNMSTRVRWNGANLVTFATMQQSDWMWVSVAESVFDVSSLLFGELNFWSQSLGGSVRIQLENCIQDMGSNSFSCDAPTADSVVAFFKEDVVYPGDSVPASLRCYDNCPKYDATAGVTRHAFNYEPGSSGHAYTFDTTELVLKEDGNPLIKTSAGSGEDMWGFMSGPIFEPTTANLAQLVCDWDPSQTCGWKAWSALSEYFTWETGQEQWNQFTALVDANGTPLRFEAPLQVEYSHSQTSSSAPDYKYNGTRFYFEYSGFGELHGIPGRCVDMDSVESISCVKENDGKVRWVPEFMVPSGATVTANGVTYYAKPLEKEQMMKAVDATVCTAAGLATTSYTLPDMNLWEDPAIGAEQDVGDAPAVIDGVLQ